MKISLNWVKEYTDVKLPVDKLVEKIGAQLGAVEEVVNLAQKYQGIVIAKVVTCEKHPNADKLQVCKIDDGGKAKSVKRDKDGYVQVVCGAPNVREGLLVAWLPPGSTVPSSYDKDPFVLEARELRGVVSNGMLASTHELALSDDHDGIAELSIGDVGSDFAKEYGLDDHIIDIENKMFTHRPDCFGQLGVAREIAGITGNKFVSPKRYVDTPKPTGNKMTLDLKVVNEAGKLVPRFIAEVFEDVEVKPSPVWLQAYLSRTGIRPINNIVDITNYIMMLTAQPLHAYDYDKLLKVSGLKTASIKSRMSKKGDKLMLLNGKELILQDDSTVLITSGDVPVGVGGVMGGADTEVDKNTKNIVLECASFDMYNIRRTSMKYGLFTDAVTRFNKGQSPLQNGHVVTLAGGALNSLTNSKPGKLIDIDDSRPEKMVRVSTVFINDRLGLALTVDEMQTLLENVEFDVERTDNKDELKVTAPFWRTDIEIPEDIVEEVGRLYGYDHLPLVLPSRDLTPAIKDPSLEFKQRVREVMAKAGANEVLTYSFVHGNLLDKVGQDRKLAFELSNALSPDLQYYRVSLTPSLLDKVHPNIKAGYEQFALFEINKSHIKGHNDQIEKNLPKEFEKLAVVIASAQKQDQNNSAYFHARRYLDYLAESLGVDLRYEAIVEEPTYLAAAPFEYKRSAWIYIGEKLIGLVGEYKSSVRKSLKLPDYCAGFEIGIKPKNFKTSTSKYRPLSKYPSVQQDISLKTPSTLAFAELYDFVTSSLVSDEKVQINWQPIDIYQGADKKHKNITLRLTIASYEKTMIDKEVNKLLDDLAKKAKAKFGAERI